MLVIVTVSVALTDTCILVPAVSVSVFPSSIVCDVEPSVIVKLLKLPEPAAPVAPVSPCGIPSDNTPVVEL